MGIHAPVHKMFPVKNEGVREQEFELHALIDAERLAALFPAGKKRLYL